MIEAHSITKTFRIHQKEPGLRASVRSLFFRKWVEKTALKDVSLTVEGGEIVGLVGANGAGKTTLVKVLAGIIHPTFGQAKVLGHLPWERRNEFRRQIALIMGQKAQLWWDLPAADCFLLLREIYRIPHAEFRESLGHLVEALGVKDLMTTQVRRLSLGERMKMELIAALVHKPKVVFLDEPTIGLDLMAQRSIRDFLLEYRQTHAPAMLLTSHYMEDIERLCKRIVIIREGSLVYDGPLQRIVSEFALHKIISARLSGPLPPDSAEWLPRLGEVLAGAHMGENVVRVKVLRDRVPGAAAAILQKLPVLDLAIEEEDIGTIIEEILKERGPAVKALGWIPHVLSTELRKAISYRADFWMQFLGTVVTEVTIAFFLWRAIFETSGSVKIGGYTFAGMMTYYVVMPLISRIVRGSDVGFISPEIYDGSLTRYLVYPVHFFGYKYVSYLAQSVVAVAQLLVVLGLFRWVIQRATGVPFAAEIGAGTIVPGLVAALASSFLYFSALAAVEMFAFWNDAIWTLLVMLRFSAQLLGGALIPLTLFPVKAQAALDWLPFRFMMSFPARVFMGEGGPRFLALGLLGCLAWGSVFLAIAGVLWRRGSYQYTAVGM